MKRSSNFFVAAVVEIKIILTRRLKQNKIKKTHDGIFDIVFEFWPSERSLGVVSSL